MIVWLKIWVLIFTTTTTFSLENIIIYFSSRVFYLFLVKWYISTQFWAESSSSWYHYISIVGCSVSLLLVSCSMWSASLSTFWLPRLLVCPSCVFPLIYSLVLALAIYRIFLSNWHLYLRIWFIANHVLDKDVFFKLIMFD